MVPPSLHQSLDAAPPLTAPPACSVLADHVNTHVDKAPSLSMPNPMPAVGDENQSRRLMIKLPARGNSGKGSENLREDVVREDNEERDTTHLLPTGAPTAHH